MRNAIALNLVLVGLVLLGGPAAADDVTGRDKILCATIQMTECFVDGECRVGPPDNWNMPRFATVDLEARTLRTTRASGEDRTSEIEKIDREATGVFLQGVDQGNAYTVRIDLQTGTATVAIALEESVLAGFAACTPFEVLQ